MNCYLNEIAGLIHRLSQALVQRPELESSGPAVLGAERSINWLRYLLGSSAGCFCREVEKTRRDRWHNWSGWRWVHPPLASQLRLQKGGGGGSRGTCPRLCRSAMHVRAVPGWRVRPCIGISRWQTGDRAPSCSKQKIRRTTAQLISESSVCTVPALLLQAGRQTVAISGKILASHFWWTVLWCGWTQARMAASWTKEKVFWLTCVLNAVFECTVGGHRRQ
jgi:hypothetical protein